MHTFELVPKGWFSWNFRVLDAGTSIAVIDISWWREKGALEISGELFSIHREHWASGAFVLESAGEPLAQAVKPGALRRSFTVSHNEQNYELKAYGWFTRKFVILENNQQVGSIQPLGPFTRKASMKIPDHLPLPVQIFMIWLTLILWKRDAGAIAATSVAVNH